MGSDENRNRKKKDTSDAESENKTKRRLGKTEDERIPAEPKELSSPAYEQRNDRTEVGKEAPQTQSEGIKQSVRIEDIEHQDAVLGHVDSPKPHSREVATGKPKGETEHTDARVASKEELVAQSDDANGIAVREEASRGMFSPLVEEVPSSEIDVESDSNNWIAPKLATESEPVEYKGEEAFVAGNATINYLMGTMAHERMNLDDAISHLRSCFEMAVETDLFEYVIKSQVQLASVHLKRFQIHDNDIDYELALEYSENLIQIGKEQELHQLWMEALILRAILRKISKNLEGARTDLKEAREIARLTEQEDVNMMLDAEIREVRRLLARATRKRRLGKEDEEQVMREALERMPAVVNGLLGIELSRKARVVPVKLYRLIVMNLPAGLPLYSYTFYGAEEEEVLVFGLLSAVSHLVSEVTPDAGRIRTLTHEGHTVMMEHRGNYMAGLFSSMESFRARQCLERFLKEYLRLYPDLTGSGQVMTQEQKESADQLLARVFRVFFA